MPSTRRATARGASDERVPIVGIGASAGGLRALQRFFDHLPGDSGMAFVVIVHLDPTYPSQMAELLQSHTSMPVEQLTRGARVEPNHVYIIAPDKELSLSDGHLRVAPRRKADRYRAPIDLFFRTLAETHESDATGVVLSGTGQDGTQGIGWIRERGGITMAQQPAEAEYDSMPRSAIETGHVDVVLPVAELAPEAVRLRLAESRRNAAERDELNTEDSAVIGKILAHVRTRTTSDFSDYKRSTVIRRLTRRMQMRRAESLPEYLGQLRSDPAEAAALVNDLLITVTSFFRDPDAFAALERDVIPQIMSDRSSEDGIRVWVAGCATGQEAYSLAMLMCEYADTLTEPPQIQIFATDAHDRAFAAAREGLYPESIAADVTPARLERFFTREPGGYRVTKQIRDMVLFANHDLLRNPPFLRLDLISCRNLLIYLERDAQRRVFDTFDYALRPGGYLFLGSSESVPEASKFTAVGEKKWRIFRSLDFERTRVPTVPLRAATTPRQLAPRSEPQADERFGSLHQKLAEAYAPPSLVVDADGKVVHFSDGVGRFLRIGGGEPTKEFLEMMPRDARPLLRAPLRRALAKGEPAVVDVRMELDGAARIVRVIVRPLVSEHQTDRFTLVLFDEEQRSRARRKAAPRATRRGVIEPQDVAHLEAELKEVRAQLQRRGEDHEAFIEELKAANEELQSINEEQKSTAEELETSAEELQSTNEELRTINQEHRIRNAEMAEINSDLLNLINSTDIGTIFLDRELRIRRYTPAATSVFNFIGADQGRPIAHLTHRLHYDGLHADARAVLQSLSRIEREVSSDDGSWYTVRLSPYRSVDDKINGVVVTFFDSTARKRAELANAALLKAAEAASAAKSDFIGVMSHEFRTPLNAIIGYADLLDAGATGPITAEQRRHLERITSSARHLAHMVDDVLASAQAEAGATKIDLQPTDLVALVSEIAAALAPTAEAKGLRLNLGVPDTPEIVFTDPTKLRQILFNLLGNAIRFTDQGQVSVRARAEANRFVIEVEDTGTGIAPEHLGRVFDRFFQADQSMTRRQGGTGLGLAVSQSLAVAMGGGIVVRSEQGKGSVFTLQLPRDGSRMMRAAGEIEA